MGEGSLTFLKVHMEGRISEMEVLLPQARTQNTCPLPPSLPDRLGLLLSLGLMRCQERVLATRSKPEFDPLNPM